MLAFCTAAGMQCVVPLTYPSGMQAGMTSSRVRSTVVSRTFTSSRSSRSTSSSSCVVSSALSSERNSLTRRARCQLSDVGIAQRMRTKNNVGGVGGKRGNAYVCNLTVAQGEVIPHKEKSLKETAAEEERERCIQINFGVVLTHVGADFDSLAAAVGLARLRDHQLGIEGSTCVVLPQGANPTVQHFLALHKHNFPIKARRAVEPKNLQWIGVVDAQRRDRFGTCAEWLDVAPVVMVYDHHMEQTSDIVGTKVIENVGSVTTLVVELLREQGVRCNEKEATLLALGIHSDTGSLVFEGTTARDVSALQYCLECGASQKAIMRFAKVMMSLDQRNMLNKAMMKMRKIEFERVTLAFAHVECEEYVPGMATVARDMMELTSTDIAILASSYIHKNKKNNYRHVSLIGRASSELECVNLAEIMNILNGGGHRKAAATSFRMDRLKDVSDEEFKTAGSIEELCEMVVRRICTTQIPPVKRASDIMTPHHKLVLGHPAMTVAEAMDVLIKSDVHTLPVVKENGVLEGVISFGDLEMEASKGLESRPISGCLKQNLFVSALTTSLPDIEKIFVEKSVSCVPVVSYRGGEEAVVGERSQRSKNPTLLGIIARTDVLREHAFYS